MHSQSKLREDLHISTSEADAPPSANQCDGLFADGSPEFCASGSHRTEGKHSHQEIEPPLDQVDSPLSPEEEAPISGPASAALSLEVNQALARLEMNSLQVKLHLDSIDERIKRIEPRLEQRLDQQHASSDAPAGASETQSPPASDLLADDSSSNPPPPPSSYDSTTDRRRRRLEITPSASVDNDLPLSPSDHLSREDLWALKPWLLARRKQVAIAAAVLLAFVTILTFGTGDHRVPPASTVPADTPAPAPLGSSAISKASAGTPVTATGDLNPAVGADPQIAASSLQSSPPQTSSQTSSSQRSSLQTSSPAASSADPLSAPGALGQQTASTSATNPSSAINNGRVPFAKPSASVPGTAIPSRVVPASGRVRVSSGVMAGNLLFSPTPRYPGGFATLFHMEGHVTMQAIIARDGHVDDLRVLSGHRLLRGAAQDAVHTWRYRPYVVNGLPVEVATIITVEFHR